MIKEIIEAARKRESLVMQVKEIVDFFKNMDEKELKSLIKDIFDYSSYDSYDDDIIYIFLKNKNDMYKIESKTDRQLRSLWKKLLDDIKKALKRMKRNDLLALIDNRECANIVRKQLNDVESDFCKKISIAIWDAYKNKMFKWYSKVIYWMKEFEVCRAIKELKDDELCEIEREGIKSIVINEKKSKEYVSISTRVSIFEKKYEIIINGHIKIEVSMSKYQGI